MILEKFADPIFWVELAAMGAITFAANKVRQVVNDVRAFLANATEDLDHIRKTDDQLYTLHTEPSDDNLFQVGKVLATIQEGNRIGKRSLSYLTASFRLILLLASKAQVDTDEVSRIQQDLAREL